MREIKDRDLNTQVIAKYNYPGDYFKGGFTFYVLSYGQHSWEIIRNVTVQSNWTQYGGGLRITYGNLDWVTKAIKDETFKPCTIKELMEGKS